MKTKHTSHLKCIFDGKKIFIAPTNGSEVFETTNEESWTAALESFIKRKDWGGDARSTPTPKVEVKVYSLSKDGDFQELFGSFGINLEELHFTQAQVSNFLRDHKDLLSKGGTTFFLIKNENWFVVAVTRGPTGSLMKPYVIHFEDPQHWSTGWPHQVVIPKISRGI